MRHLFIADIRELKGAFLWVVVVMVALVFSGYYYNWGMYNIAANYQSMWTALPMIGIYMPLAVMFISENNQDRTPRLAMLACLPLTRVQIGLSRYLAPLAILAVAIIFAWFALSVEIFFRDWYFLGGSNSVISGPVYKSNLINLVRSMLLFTVPLQILLGAAAMTVPLMVDDIWPTARSKSYGIFAMFAGSFVVSELGAISAQGLWSLRMPWTIAGTLMLVVIETGLFCRRRSLV